MPAAGTTQPYRPVPRDFRERFPQVGWTSAELEWSAHAKTIARWLDECGRDEMRAARAEYIRVNGRGSRRTDYVLGKRLRRPCPVQAREMSDHLDELSAVNHEDQEA